MAIGQHKRLLLAGRVQHLAARRHRALQVLAQEGIGQFAKPLVGRILMVALMPQQMILLGAAGKRQLTKVQGVLAGELPGDVGRGGQQAVGTQQHLHRRLKEGHPGKPAPTHPLGCQHLFHRAVLVTPAAHLQMGPGEIVIETERAPRQRMVATHQHHQPIFPLMQAADLIRHQFGDGGDHVQLGLPQLRQQALVPQAVLQRRQRRLPGQRRADVRQDVLGHVIGRGEPEHPLAAARVKTGSLVESLERPEGVRQLGGQRLGPWRQQPALPLPHQQLVAKLAAQLAELLADGRLAQVQQLRRPADVAGLQQHLEGRQQVEIGFVQGEVPSSGESPILGQPSLVV